MITIIRDSPLRLFDYWKKPVKGRLGRASQNDSFIAVISSQERSSLCSESYESWFQGENNRLNTDLHTSGAIRIPIASRHTKIPCLRHAVSSLGACPTPAL